MSSEKKPAGTGKIALITAGVFAFGGMLVGLQSGQFGFALGTALATGAVGLPVGAAIGVIKNGLGKK